MRFTDRANAAETIRRAIGHGFNYIDTSPCYCRQSEEENSEAWVGSAVREAGWRSRVMVSTKSAVGNGGLGLGELDLENGFSVRGREDFRRIFAQSLRRLGLPRVDFYHLWTTHTMEQFAEAGKSGGWMDGLREHRSLFDHLGLTTHADSATIIKMMESGLFEALTLPLNVVNTTRLEAVRWCIGKGVPVLAMNPLAGGFLASHPRLKELALRYLMCLEGVHLLIGFSSPEEADYAAWIQKSHDPVRWSAEGILKETAGLLGSGEARCTACGYCQPCPENINVGACLSYFNLYKYLGMEEAKKAFLEKQWEDGLKLERCRECGLCGKRCPNRLPLKEIIAEARASLYG